MIFVMDKNEAIDYIYQSYLKCEKYLRYGDKDALKRDPILTFNIIRSLSSTPCAVITGSKGKGSVAVMTAAILETKMKTGLMTSPHLTDFNERFRINGEIIKDDEFIRYVDSIRTVFDGIASELGKSRYISPIGIQTVLALMFFNNNRTRFNVLECGKGAKYDDVNNVLHEYAVINSIFMEHVRELGGTLQEIAEDKAHVITGDQKCVYSAWQEDCVMDIIKERAKSLDTPLKIYGIDFKCDNIKFSRSGMHFDVVIGDETYDDIQVPLLGEHQAKNCALSMVLCRDVLGSIDIMAVRKKLSSIDWPGRMEILSSDPFILLDACINQASAKFVKSTVHRLDISKYTLIVGIPDDKDFVGVIETMQDHAKRIILTKSGNAHYIFTERQRLVLESMGIHTIWTSSISEALLMASGIGLPTIILGTTSVVSEVKAGLRQTRHF